MSPLSAGPRSIHPFPARMAPHIALEKVTELTTAGQVVLDPMCGSGTVVRVAAQEGRQAIGCDLDPLAVLMTRTACNSRWSTDLTNRAERLVAEAGREGPSLPAWIADDNESTDFVKYWFAREQRLDLSRLAKVLAHRPRADDALRIALSRMIVTKEGGASLARDTSHSRPHKVREVNDFDVSEEFLRSAAKLERVLAGDPEQPSTSARVRSVDARKLGFVPSSSIDLVVTSPPYLNAIDYLRGHRLSLVWLGYTLAQVRELRGTSIGSERGLREAAAEVEALALKATPQLDDLQQRDRAIALRFVHDMDQLCRSLGRVTKPGGHLVFVVADSQVRGVPVSNSAICKLTAARHGFSFVGGTVRSLPAKHRYLPPPDAGESTLSSRMREEAVLTFSRSDAA